MYYAIKQTRSWYKSANGIDTDSIQDVLTAEVAALGYPSNSIELMLAVTHIELKVLRCTVRLRIGDFARLPAAFSLRAKKGYLRKAIVGGARVSIRLRKKSYSCCVRFDDMRIEAELNNYRSSGKSDLRNFSMLVEEFVRAIQGELRHITRQLEKRSREMYAELDSLESLDVMISEKDISFNADGSRYRTRDTGLKRHYAHYA